MLCACDWGWFKNGTRCPTHFCGQPSPEDVDLWIMAEDDSPHPREVWMERRARAVSRVVDASVKALVSGCRVVLRKPIIGETWCADTHLTGRTVREILDWEDVAVVDVTPFGEVTSVPN